MRPQWFNLDQIPYNDMWPDDQLWLGKVLNDQQFYGYFKFKDMVEIMDYRLHDVKSFDEVTIPYEPIKFN